MSLRREGGSPAEIVVSVLFALLLVGGTVVLILLPQLREHLRLEEAVRRAALENAAQQQTYDRLYELHSVRRDSDGVLLERLDSAPDPAALSAWMSRYLPGASVSEKGDGSFLVSAFVGSPAAYYRALEALKEAPWVLRALPPVEFRMREGKKLSLRFRVRAVAAAR